MPNTEYDVLFLYNERETSVSSIANELRTNGYRVFIWREDVQYGEKIDADETTILRTSTVVLAFLGTKGWGPNHIKRVEEARRLERRIIPVLIGQPADTDLLAVNGLFKDNRYVDVRKISHDAINKLIEAIGAPLEDRNTSRYDEVIRTLIDGNDDQRASILYRIKTADDIYRGALAGRLRREISQRFSLAKENDLSSATRDRKKIASIRSWMISCLIWTDAESDESRQILLNHVDAGYEQDAVVQYWTLAGLYLKQVSYLDAA
ncbi:MAG: TIR domain-containing protein, partial [Bacteroidia bacterium]